MTVCTTRCRKEEGDRSIEGQMWGNRLFVFYFASKIYMQIFVYVRYDMYSKCFHTDIFSFMGFELY